MAYLNTSRLVIKTLDSFNPFILQQIYNWNSWNTNLFPWDEVQQQKKWCEAHNGYSCLNYIALLRNDPNQVIGQYKILNGYSFLMINPKYMNQGYGTEIVSNVIQNASIATIRASINAQNIASQKVFLKSGFIPKIITNTIHIYEYKK